LLAQYFIISYVSSGNKKAQYIHLFDVIAASPSAARKNKGLSFFFLLAAITIYQSYQTTSINFVKIYFCICKTKNKQNNIFNNPFFYPNKYLVEFIVINDMKPTILPKKT